MVTYNSWQIVAVPFPFTDKNQTKKRPALVINKSDFQTTQGHVILLMITSAKNSNWSSDIPITDLKSAGLNNPSVIRFKMFTLDERLIIKETGTLVKKDREEVIKKLNAILELEP